jgi:hypothetical protein
VIPDRQALDAFGIDPPAVAPANVRDTELSAAVAIMLGAAGLTVGPADHERLLALYEAARPGIDALYALSEARYESLALVFQAAPTRRSWLPGVRDG